MMPSNGRFSRSSYRNLLLANLEQWIRFRFVWHIGQIQKQIAGIRSVSQSRFPFDNPTADELLNFAVEMLHALLIADAHRIKQGLAFDLAFFDILPSAQSSLQDFDDRHASRSVFSRNQPLRNDVAKALGQPVSQRVLFRHRKYTHDSLHRLRRVNGM